MLTFDLIRFFHDRPETELATWTGASIDEAKAAAVRHIHEQHTGAAAPDLCGECGEYWPCTVQTNRKRYRPDVVCMHTIKR